MLENRKRYRIRIVNVSCGGDYEASYLTDRLSGAAEELARWRAGTFVALHSSPQVNQVVVKAERGGTNGLYLREGLQPGFPLRTLAEVGTTPGTAIDPLAPAASLSSRAITEVWVSTAAL